MPRRAFVADLGEAVKACAAGEIDLHNLQSGDDDGDFKFSYGPPGQSLEVEAHVSVDDYPASHTYFIYTSSENVDPGISRALENFSLPEGVKLSQMLIKVAKILGKAIAGSITQPINLDADAMDIDTESQDNQCSSEEELDSEFGGVSDPEEDDDGGFSPPPPRRIASGISNRSELHMNLYDLQELQEHKAKLRKDILATKHASFRVALLGDLLNPKAKSFLTISCRISRLGISQEAMQAWNLDPSRYLTLVIQFSHGYKTLQQVSDESPTHDSLHVHMRVGSTKLYKINYSEACDAFRDTKSQEKEQRYQEPSNATTSTTATIKDSPTKMSTDPTNAPITTDAPGLNSIFISRPLNELLNQRLLHLIKYRVNLGMPWGGAELYYNLSQGRQMHDLDPTETRFVATENTEKCSHLPKLVTNDHLNDANLLGYTAKGSLPLLAMQFVLRHVVRCTDFCLVCHVKIDADFEALKPYVCSSPLCLYQYLNLGMGPAIEHEILTQPDVVDLLVSFCYASARVSKLKNLPIGMTLMVPHMVEGVMAPAPFEPRRLGPNPYSPQATLPSRAPPPSVDGQKPKDEVKFWPAKLDQFNSELLFDSPIEGFRPGDWIYVIERLHKDTKDKIHYKVLSVKYRGLCLGPAISTAAPLELGTGPLALSSSGLEVDVYRYDRFFDDLTRVEQLATIGPLLNTLPSIAEMGEWLRTNHGRTLEQWTERVSPTALGLLRWIIASNRSCIVQVDNQGSKGSMEERVGGMKDYLQFRFAQGAPDKEQRFINAIHENTRKNRPKQATIFAWHGSALYNWHGIVREGLNFEETVNGRAYGHGVYHSLHASTSIGYTGGRYGYGQRYGEANPSTWRQSRLQVEHALSLNEIVNSPSEFVSSSPHLVVSQLDWIQTRYLFVKSSVKDIGLSQEIKSAKKPELIEQDPRFTPQGPTSEPLRIPITAVSKSRRPAPTSPKVGEKRSTADAFLVDGHIVLSDDTDAEDLEILLEPDVMIEDMVTSNGKSVAKNSVAVVEEEPPKIIIDSKMTDFVPGTVNHDTLPLLDPPTYATPQGTRTLQRQLQETLKTQATTPIHQLGWYIDPELVTNMYQWIVELHSFDSLLPLCKDLKSKNLKSIVLEFRFGASFPFSPPFVRVIRPRFLPLMQGGGGHVTAGGAMCMQLLTNDGWSSVNNMESVLLQIKLAIESTEPKPARLENGPVRDYQIGEAVEAFRRACRTHGWTVPEDFRSIAAVQAKEKEPVGLPARF